MEALRAVLSGVTKLGLCGRNSTGQAHWLQELLLPQLKVQEGVGKAKPGGIAPLLGQSAGAARGDWAGRGMT